MILTTKLGTADGGSLGRDEGFIEGSSDTMGTKLGWLLGLGIVLPVGNCDGIYEGCSDIT